MKCERCGKRDAVIKMTRIKDGSVHEMHVCQECAAEISPYQAKLAMKTQQISVDTLLKELLENQQAAKVVIGGAVSGGSEVEPCPTCGLDFARYKSSLMLGCPDCYEAFGEHLLQDLERMQGATRHVGHRRAATESILDFQARHRALSLELQDSVENEDFERAAYLRDEMRKLEEAMDKGGRNR